MKRIRLTQGKFAIVSDIDYAFLNQWKWCASNEHGYWYAIRNIHKPKHKIVRMHRVILKRMGYKKFKDTDHIDGNGLDNRRIKLRIATRNQNNINSFKRKNSISKYKGVYYLTNRLLKKSWYARLSVNGKMINLGYYKTAIEAAKAYNKAAKKYFGKFARLNKV